MSARARPLLGRSRLFVERRIVRVPDRAFAVEGLGVPGVEGSAEREAPRQVGIGDEELAEGHRVRFAGCRSRPRPICAIEPLVGDIDAAERRLQLRAECGRADDSREREEGDAAPAEFARAT